MNDGRAAAHTKGKWRVGCAALLLVSVLATNLVHAGERGMAEFTAQKRLTITSLGLTTSGSLQGYCLVRPRRRNDEFVTEECPDVTYTSDPAGHLPVKPRETIRLRTGPRATRVVLTLERPNRRKTGPVVLHVRQARRVSGNRGRVWRVRLPRGLKRATYAGVGVRYGDDGFANFAVGVRLPSRCRD